MEVRSFSVFDGRGANAANRAFIAGLDGAAQPSVPPLASNSARTDCGSRSRMEESVQSTALRSMRIVTCENSCAKSLPPAVTSKAPSL